MKITHLHHSKILQNPPIDPARKFSRFLGHQRCLRRIGNEAKFNERRRHGGLAQDIKPRSDKDPARPQPRFIPQPHQNVLRQRKGRRGSAVNKGFTAARLRIFRGIGVNADEVICPPGIRVIDPRGKARRIACAENHIVGRTRQPRLKRGIGLQKIKQRTADSIRDVLLTDTVRLRTGIGVFRIVSLIDIDFDCHILILSRYHT